ncbi:hypothetical protein RclHR1_08020006 [Rhizophagus clarus]|uniref:Kinase-like domain-containing protein n=1 Tax=Rhizophagus clarus TaxID=94130 RepID=A0A2Z6S651_9GLOM|nr:hypothetical protein RclHR1_08020006 [Rhizophagus clarus]GET03525.1 kinase-like domain-containing protein [Rhizophagus clarus]
MEHDNEFEDIIELVQKMGHTSNLEDYTDELVEFVQKVSAAVKKENYNDDEITKEYDFEHFIIVDTIVNVLSKLYNSDDSEKLRKFITYLVNINSGHYYDQQILNKEFGVCPECNQPNTHENWCKDCYSKKFQQKFGSWTSGNEHIDKFIQDSQLSARSKLDLLEWIPYDRLRNIKYLTQGGFSTIYDAVWLDGLKHWEYYEEQYFLDKLVEQVLKNLNDSSNIHEDFLNEWKLYLQCQHKIRSNGSRIVTLFGITQDPSTLDYIIVMEKVEYGSLRNNLLIKKYNPNDKFQNLCNILVQLEGIHKLNLVHGDFHDGNLLCMSHDVIMISDLGLCKPVNQSNIKNEIYGVLPYIAPEVLRGKPYKKSADMYSFGIIMWEMTSGVPAFHNRSHDFDLSLDICQGIRPEIIEGTMSEYVELMKRCWDNDPKKRPTANELIPIFLKWTRKYPAEKDEEKRVPVPENEPKVVYHPKSCYSSRKFNDSAKLNEILEQEELSNKIIKMGINSSEKIVISENFDDCIVKD